MTSEQILKSDMLDILFDGRNKAYGAYELRRKYEKDLGRALLIGILITLSLFGYSYYREHFSTAIEDETGPIYYDPLPPFKIPEKQEVIPVKIIPAKAGPTKSYVTPVIRQQVIEVENLTNINDLAEKDPGTVTTVGFSGISGTIGLEGDAAPDLSEGGEKGFVQILKEEEKVFKVVEQQPEFPGGEGAMYRWISDNLKYPKEAYSNGLEGQVIMQFTVEKDGSISSVVVVRDAVGGGAATESINMVDKMPAWKAGRQNGKPVRVMFTLPINFTLKQ